MSKISSVIGQYINKYKMMKPKDLEALADSGEPVACAAADLFGNYAFLRDVASAQNFRNRGLARACVCTLCEPLRERNKQVFLLAAESTAGFYRKCGFIKTDTVGPGNIKS